MPRNTGDNASGRGRRGMRGTTNTPAPRTPTRGPSRSAESFKTPAKNVAPSKAPAKTPTDAKTANQQKQGSGAAGTFAASAAGAMVGSALGSAITGPRAEAGSSTSEKANWLRGKCADQFFSVLCCAENNQGNLENCRGLMDELVNCHQDK